jgi:ribonuclease D
MHLSHITTQNQLHSFCESLLKIKPHILSVDTEFIRKTTYWPKLCLIQLAFHDQIALIDPLVENLDLSPLKPIFLDNEILKIFHAARQDLEVLYKLWGEVPQSIADTQILAMVCGFGDSVSYDKLSEAVVKKKVDKSQQHTDWAQRPLSQKQLAYAAGDVEWLQSLYEKLLAQAGPKAEYIQEELDLLKNPALYQPDPENAWLKIKHFIPYKPDVLGALKAIAAVREHYAQTQNKPRSHIIKDEVLTQIALKSGLSAADLAALGLKDVVLQKDLLQALHTATPIAKHFEPKDKRNSFLVDLLNILLKTQSETHGIAPKLIATRERIDLFLENPNASPLMQGWRAELFGEIALSIREGKTALAFDGETRKPKFVEL